MAVNSYFFNALKSTALVFYARMLMEKIDLTKRDMALEASFKSLLTVSSSPFNEFIDYKKLMVSSIFEQAWTFAARKYERAGDVGHMDKLINCLPLVDLKLFLCGYACERFALQALCEDRKTIRLRKNKKKQPNATLGLAQCLSEFRASRMNIEKYKNGAYASLKGLNEKTPIKKVPERSTDLLDSWLILPGSFGSGQRR